MTARRSPSFARLPREAQVYVAAVIALGAAILSWCIPTPQPQPLVFILLVMASCMTSAWKVNLPIPLASGSTLSVSYAANLTALLLLGPRAAVLVAAAGAWTQCTVSVKCAYPLHRTAFSVCAEAVTMAATGIAYLALGGALAPHNIEALPGPLVGAIATYFVLNTGLVAGAIALSTRQSPWRIWRDDFLWSGASFFVAGIAGAIAAVVVVRGGHFAALLLMAPVYLIYTTYQTVVGRLDDQRRHLEEAHRLHEDAVSALGQARCAEQALIDEKERLAVTLRGIADGVIVTDPDGTVVLINKVAAAMTGWQEQTAVGMPLESVFQDVDPDTRMRCDNSIRTLSAPLAEPGMLRCTLLVARDLTERSIEASVATLRDDYSRTMGVVLVFRDITYALKAQEERAQANRMSALGLLAGGIGQDFNNILMGIVGNVSLARTTMVPTKAAADALANAEQACVRARQLTWQLLAFSKGGIPCRRTLRMDRVLEQAVHGLHGGSVSYELDVSSELWSVDADESQLLQALTSVLSNAQEAMPNGGTVVVRAENIVERDGRAGGVLRVEPGRYVRISVSDKGTGIAPELLGRIFDPYFSSKPRGSGLGLATTQSILKNHGGFVDVESRVRLGTTVRLAFPATIAPTRIDAPAAPRLRGGSRGRVLVMDDEASVRTLASNMLEFLGFQAEAAPNGVAAIERFNRALSSGQPFDVVMLDLLSPGGMAGRETMAELARMDPTIKSVFVNGGIAAAPDDDLAEAGFGAVIAKPFTLQELNTTLHSVLASSAFRVH